MLEHVGGAPDGRHVVHDQLAVGGQEVAPLVQLLDTALVLTVCGQPRITTARTRGSGRRGVDTGEVAEVARETPLAISVRRWRLRVVLVSRYKIRSMM